MRRAFVIFIIVALLSYPGFADIDAALKNGIGARSAAMGLAQVAVAEGSEAIYWNPATIAGLKQPYISTTASDIYGTNYKTFSLALPAWDGGFGILVLGADQSGIPETSLDSNGRPVVNGYFGYDAKAFYLSYARNVGRLSVGGNLKYLSEGLDGFGANGIGADIGLLIQPSDILSLGAKIENIIAPQMKWNTNSGSCDSMDTSFAIGGSLKPNKGKLLLTGDMHFEQNQTPEFFVGGEYEWNDNFSLRGGLFDGKLSCGVGIDYHNFDVDYSYAKGNDYLEDSHRISLSFAFGQDWGIVREPALQEVVVVGEEPAVDPISFYAHPALPGKTLYIKVLTSGVEAERVSVFHKGEKTKLYAHDPTTWKGDFELSRDIQPGEHELKVYVADSEGHLHKLDASFTVKPFSEGPLGSLPQIAGHGPGRPR